MTPLSGGLGGVATVTARSPVRALKAQMRGARDAADVHRYGGGPTAAAQLIPGLGEERLRGLLPFAVVTAPAAVRSVAIKPGLALLVARGCHGTALTGTVNAAAVAANAGSADGHGYSPGMAGSPLDCPLPIAVSQPSTEENATHGVVGTPQAACGCSADRVAVITGPPNYATGARAGWPRMAVAPIATDVPPLSIVTTRR